MHSNPILDFLLKTSSSSSNSSINTSNDSINMESREMVKTMNSFTDLLRILITEYNISHKQLVEYMNECIEDFSADMPYYKILYTIRKSNNNKVHDKFNEFIVCDIDRLNAHTIVYNVEKYGQYVLEFHPKLKEVLYIYEVNHIDAISKNLRYIIDVQNMIDNVANNKNYIETLTQNMFAYGQEIADFNILYLPHVEFLMITKLFTFESLKKIATHKHEIDLQTMLVYEQERILNQIPMQREDVYSDMLETFRKRSKHEWFKRRGPFYDIFQNYNEDDPGMWNSQHMYDSLGIQYLIEKANEKDFAPIQEFDNDVLQTVYIRFGILCAFLEHKNIWYLDVPYYYDKQLFLGKEYDIIEKIEI